MLDVRCVYNLLNKINKQNEKKKIVNEMHNRNEGIIYTKNEMKRRKKK